MTDNLIQAAKNVACFILLLYASSTSAGLLTGLGALGGGWLISSSIENGGTLVIPFELYVEEKITEEREHYFITLLDKHTVLTVLGNIHSYDRPHKNKIYVRKQIYDLIKPKSLCTFYRYPNKSYVIIHFECEAEDD